MLPLNDAMRCPFLLAALLAGLLLTAPAPAGAIPIRGRVVTAQGEGLAGARVVLRLRPDDWQEGRRFLTPVGGAEAAPPTPTAAVETDPDGRFRLEAPGAGMWELRATAPGQVPLHLPLAPLLEGRGLPPAVFPPARTVTLRVIDPAGASLPGARVRILLPSPGEREGATEGSELRWRPSPDLAVTGADGTARFHLPVDAVPVIHCAAPGHAPGRTEEVGGGEAICRLERGTRGSLEIRGESGKPLAGAVIRLGEGRVPTLVTGEDGRGEVVVPERGLEVEILARDGRRAAFRWLPTDLSPARTVRLPPPRRLTGRVESTAGEGLPGALVWLADHPARFQVAGDGGRFDLAVPGRGGLRLAAAAAGHLPAQATGRPGGTGLVLRLQPATVTGRGCVRGPEGQPVAGVEVTLRPAPGSRGADLPSGAGEEPWAAVTGPRGCYRIAGLVPGRFDLEARARGYAPLTVPGIAVRPGTGAVDLGTVLLAPGADLEGCVTDPEERALAEVEVLAVPAGQLPPDPGGDGGSLARTVTAGDGCFRLEGLSPGRRVDLHFRRQGYATAHLDGLPVPPEEPVRVALRPAARVAGRVVEPGGRGIPEARVELSIEVAALSAGARVTRLLPAGEAETDSGGDFAIEEVEPGAGVLEVAAEGWAEARVEVEVEPGQALDGVEIVLEPEAVLTGRVTAQDGRPVPGAAIQVGESEAGAGSPRLSTESGEEGRYRLAGLASGRRRVTAWAEGHLPVSETVELEAGENHLDLTLPSGVEISGRVVDAAGEPVAGARVGARGLRPEAHPHEAPSLADGSFAVEVPAAGRYRLQADKPGFARAVYPQEVTVTGSPVSGIEIRLSSGGEVRGRVLGLSLEELARVRLFATSVQGSFAQGEVSPDGSYRVPRLAAGDWRVEAHLLGTNRSAEGTVRLAPGQAEAVLDLELATGLTLTGRVLLDGTPRPGLSVSAQGLERSSHGSDVTDGQGRFRIEGLTPGLHLLDVADLGSALRYRQEVEILEDRQIVVDLQPGRVRGRVVAAPAGDPVAGARIELRADGTAGSSLRGPETDARGRFLVAEVAPGRYHLTAAAPGYAPGEVPVEVQPGAEVGELELVLQPSPGLVLEVSLASGLPVQGVTVALLAADGRVVADGSYPADAGGRVRISEAPPGRWELVIAAPGAAPATIAAVSVPGETLQVVLPPPGRLLIQVPELAAGDTPATATLAGPDGRLFRRPTGRGRVEERWPVHGGRALVEVPAGLWQVRVEASDGRVWNGEAVVAAGSLTELDLP